MPQPTEQREGAERLSRAEFVRAALTAEIATMLDDLGNPALVERIFPKGWRNADDAGLANLFDLCLRTFATRATP